MADEYDPLDPPTFDAAAEDEEAYDPTEYENYDQQDAGDEDDDYDPSSFNFGGDSSEQQATPTESASAAEDPPAPVAKAPKPQQKVAGFIVEESDDEQDESVPTPSQSNGTSGAQSGFGAVAASEAQDVSLSSAPQDTATSSTSLNGSTTVHVPASTSPSLPDPSLQQPIPEQGKTISPVASAQASFAPTPQPPAPAVAAAPEPSAIQTNGTTSQQPARLPHDKVGQLEDRIKDDPKGDTDAWWGLIEHYTDKGQYDQVRAVHERFSSVFPKTASLWKRRILMERELDERDRVVSLLGACVTQVPNVDLFKIYLDHVRRVMPLLNDDGTNLATIDQAFSLAFDQVGTDPDAGVIYRDYIEFLQETPGSIGGSSVKDGQKVDRLRVAYQRAIRVPHSESVKMWKEYEAFEMGLHKATGRKHIQEQSPLYVESRKAKVQLDQKVEGLDRVSLPRLPPIYGCAGEEEFGTQVEKWRAWIAWERDEDPLVLKGTEDAIWRQRVLYAYQQATMSLYFYPDIWFEAASWCFAQGDNGAISQAGEKFLEDGIAANPESVLLAMMKADRIESSLESGNTDEILIRNGNKLDVPYEAVLTALYALRTKMVEKDKKAVAQIHDYYASFPPDNNTTQTQDQDDDEDAPEDRPLTRDEQKKAQIDAVKAASAGQLDMLKRTISYVWVAKMRAFRRVQGQGHPQKKGGPPIEPRGFRGIFSEARPRGFISSDVYIASALIEWNSYRDSSAGKIFERGLKLFPTDEIFVLEYVKHLMSEGDVTNARVVFESTVSKINNSADSPQEQKRDKCRPLFVFMHDYESKYGDLAQIHKLERRMAELYPEEPDVSRFSNRFSLPTFDAMNVQLLLSPTQAQPKTNIPIAAPPQQAMTSIEDRLSPKVPEILLGPNGPYVASPKRPLEDSDTDTPQRKFMRAESPLKGAAGVRMQGKATTTGGAGGGFATKTFVPANVAAVQAPPAPLPPIIDWFLRILPNAAAYNGVRFDPAKLVQFMPTINPHNARR